MYYKEREDWAKAKFDLKICMGCFYWQRVKEACAENVLTVSSSRVRLGIDIVELNYKTLLTHFSIYFDIKSKIRFRRH